jgi:hypothetical protein
MAHRRRIPASERPVTPRKCWRAIRRSTRACRGSSLTRSADGGHLTAMSDRPVDDGTYTILADSDTPRRLSDKQIDTSTETCVCTTNTKIKSKVISGQPRR